MTTLTSCLSSGTNQATSGTAATTASADAAADTVSTTEASADQSGVTGTAAGSVEYKSADLDDSWDSPTATITLNGGSIRIIASDDGVNIAGGADGSSLGGRPGQNNFTAASGQYLEINGGYLYLDAAGDGIDVNGPLIMTGGTVIANGPTSDANGALDYTGSFTMTGGFLVAVGSSGMAQAPDSTSTQYSVMINYSEMYAAGTLVHIEDASGHEILTFSPAKSYNSVVLCSPELAEGTTYTVYAGGQATGTITDGLYLDASYTAGTQFTTFTITSLVTTIGSAGGRINPGRR